MADTKEMMADSSLPDVEKTATHNMHGVDGSGSSDGEPESTVLAEAEKNLGEAAVPSNPPGPPAITFPEGGPRAWACAIGAACVVFCTFGYVNAFGVYQEYYQENQLRHETPSAISWIGSLQVFFLFGGFFFGGPLFDRFGEKILWPASIVYVFSVMMTSICKQYWEFMLAQGVLGGIMTGFCMAPAVASVGQYFNKKRGLALGIVVSGSSLGGVIYPIMLTRLLYRTNVGFGWSVRIAGFLMVPLFVVGVLGIKARLPPRARGFIIWRAFKSGRFLMAVLAVFFMLLGVFIPIFYLPTYGLQHGMSSDLSSYLVAILNGASFFGRVIPGIMADKIGRVNVLSGAGVISGVLIFCWTSCHSHAAIIAFAALYGFFSGAIVSCMSVVFAATADEPRNIGTYMGQAMFIISFAALIGPPVNGVLVNEHHSFDQSAIMSGVFTTVGGALAIFVKLAFGQKLTAKF